MPLGYFLVANWRKILVVLLVAMAMLPFIALHLFVLAARLSEPPLTSAKANTITLADGQRLHVYERLVPNAKRTIVFIHGSPATAKVFHKQFEESWPETNLIAYDRPGFGGSGLSARTDHLRYQVETLGELLEARQLTNCILVGHSYGGPIALQSAITLSNHVRAVVLVGGSVDPAQEKVGWYQKLANWPIVAFLLPAEIRNCNCELMPLREDLDGLVIELAKVQVPVAMVHGAKDRMVPVANMDFLESEFRRLGKQNLFSKKVCADCDHFIPWVEPALLNETIRQQVSHHGAQSGF